MRGWTTAAHHSTPTASCIRDGALDEDFLDLIVAALGITRDQVIAHQWVDNGPGWAFEMRTFAPGAGVPEDPVCGSMNASVGQWLTATGAAPATYRVSQGTRIGRAGTVEITADPNGTVWVGGAAISHLHGTITL